MSLINDALRRKDQEKKETNPPQADGSPMQAVHPPTRGNASYLGPILIVLIVLVLLLAALLFWKGFETKKALATASPAPAQLQPLASKPVETKPLPVSVPAQATQPAVPAPAETIPTNPPATNSAAPTNPPAVVAPPVPPPLKLQGIFFRPSNPTAMINGKTVGIGEVANGARVLKIERQSVTVERDGKSETLYLE